MISLEIEKNKNMILDRLWHVLRLCSVYPLSLVLLRIVVYVCILEMQHVLVSCCIIGLTCTEQNVVTKAGAQKYADEHGIAFVCPDTSPRMTS